MRRVSSFTDYVKTAATNCLVHVLGDGRVLGVVFTRYQQRGDLKLPEPVMQHRLRPCADASQTIGQPKRVVAQPLRP